MLRKRHSAARTGTALWFILFLSACSSMYYNTLEKFGVEKRDILVDRVADARESQDDAKRQFESALEQFQSITGYEGGKLEQQYRTLKDEYNESERKARQVTARIDDVQRVAEDLFEEWGNELQQYEDAKLRRASARQLQDTRARYRRLIDAMRRAEKRMEPVLTAFQDRVLFLKHNLNAQAIASLRSQRVEVESEAAALIQDMNRSIAEADQFLQAMAPKWPPAPSTRRR